MLPLRSIFVNSLRLRDCMFSTKIPYPGDKALIPTQPENSKVDCAILGHVPEFDQKLISHLEKLSLIRFTDEQAVASLRSSVHLALGLQLVDVTGVAPMHTVWENQECPLHDDIPEKPLTVEKVLSNASKRVDDFLVSPPGNIPLDESEPLDLKVINQWDKLGVSPTVMHNRRKDLK